MWLNIAAALLPVVAFLAILVLMDSFKLVRQATVAAAVAAGAIGAIAAAVLNSWLGEAGGVPPVTLTRYVAPVIEEALKAAFIVALLRRRRLGFLVDGAILGFAVGTGFALVENLVYLRTATDTRFVYWMVRGLGTALLHGATQAVFAMLAKSLSDRHPAQALPAIAGAWLVAVGLHSAFNHFMLSPLLTTLLLLVLLPLVVSFVFERSEKATREWVGEGLDVDVELHTLLTSASVGESRLGRYLGELQARFPGPVVADMFCLLQVELELAIRARGMLMAREAGLEVPADPAIRGMLDERRYLLGTIGPTGVLALAPLRGTTHTDAWHHFLLEQAGSPDALERIRDRISAAWRRLAS